MLNTTYNFTISDDAADRINLLNNNGASYLRVTVDGGGCSGFQYQYSFTNEVNDDDYIVNNNGAKALIDSLSAQFMNDCVIDFVNELVGSRFTIKNPNITEKCGCGNSFAV